jgi:orotate phosphoribosyltransferase
MAAPLGGAALAESTVEAIFEAAGAVRDGHFLLKSGRHAGRYLEKFAVLQHPAYAVELSRRLADALVAHDPSVVVGPTTGGVLLAFEGARQLGDRLGHPVRGIFAEPSPAGRELRRGFQIGPADRVVLVDDVLTTGASLRETATAVRAAGGEPLAAAVIMDRSGVAGRLGLPVTALGAVDIPSWPPEDCPLCAAGEPLMRPGTT